MYTAMWKWVIPVLLLSRRNFSKFRVTGEPSCALWSSTAPASEGWALPSHESQRWLKQSEHFEESKIKAVGESPGWNPSLSRYFDTGTSVPVDNIIVLFVRDCRAHQYFLCCLKTSPHCKLLKSFCWSFFPSLLKTETFTSAIWPGVWVPYETWEPLFEVRQTHDPFL